MYRHNQALEQDSVCMQAEKLRLEQEAHKLSQTLSAVMNDKFEIHRTEFDADTPIDKVLNMMHELITKVRESRLEPYTSFTLRLTGNFLANSVAHPSATTASCQHAI